MPKIGFVDCLSNAFDSFEIATTIIDKEFAGTSLQRLTAPEILKMPVCAKKLLGSGGVDVVIAFVTATPEDFDSLHLLVEKTIDLELEFQKYVFYCVVSEEEFSSQAEFEKIASERLTAFIDLSLKALHSPAEVSSQIGTGVDFSMFAAFAQGSDSDASVSAPAPASEPKSSESSGRSLF
ncbi:MAG: hypothetical protein Q8R15_01540 [Candidatus Micrarchaeota archaeon]|nr:hypothetical protein [Candidatus Micrarchaeota archaeon]